MKIGLRNFLIAFALHSCAISFVLGKPVAATITMGKNKQDFPGYVTKADDNNIYISQFENGVSPAGYALAGAVSYTHLTLPTKRIV